MNSDRWYEIFQNYKEARTCLCCPKNITNWHRDDDKGMYHLWQAYYEASQEEEKDPLLYARILMMMYHESQHYSAYNNFNKFVKPAKESYDLAEIFSMRPSKEEMDSVNRAYDALKYEIDRTSDSEEEYNKAYALIEGLSGIPEFGFHDCKPVYFEHDENTAQLRLKSQGMLVELRFDNVLGIHVDTDPVSNWIGDFYCYRSFYNPDIVIFDIGCYRIECNAIVAKIATNREGAPI